MNIDTNKYEIVNAVKGHIKFIGKESGKEKNPLCNVIERENKKELILMYCEVDTICILCPIAYQKILDYEKTQYEGKKLTFFKMQNGYICATNKLFIHQIIMNCYGNGKGTKNVSVDHIDRNPLNNTMENLRIATRKEQEQNSKGTMAHTKRARKHNAKELPEGITQDMLQKHVVYYHEFVDKEKTKSRCFFKVETHPKLDKIWIGTKSNKVAILQKLQMANKVVKDLEKDIYPEVKEVLLPKYITLKMEREKPHLIFDKKSETGKLLNLRMVLPEDYVLEQQLPVFIESIKAKYDIIINT